VVGLAPRAPEDSVRPRRLSGVVVRPLNFTVRGTVRETCWTWARRPSRSPVLKSPSFPRRLAPQLRRPSCTASWTAPVSPRRSPPRTLALRRCVGGSTLRRRLRSSLRFAQRAELRACARW